MTARLIVLALHLAIYFALLLGFEHGVSVLFAYEGYFFSPDPTDWGIALVLVILLSLITPTDSSKPSTLLYQFTVSFVLLPMIVLFYAEHKPLEQVGQMLVAYAVLVTIPYCIRIVPPRFSSVSIASLQTILMALTILYIALIFLLGGGAYLNFDLTKVYDFREDAARNLPGVFGYLSPLVGKVIVPIAFVLSLIYRRRMIAIMLFLTSVLIFGLTAHKSTLFSPFLILLIYLVSRKGNLALKLNIAILIILLGTLADFWLSMQSDDSSFGWAGNFIMRRVFFVPASINYMYYDFFGNHDFVYFSNSKFSLGLLDYPYALEPAHLIGREYFDSDHIGANTGWLGSGYMQAGLTGLILYGLLIGLMFAYIDGCSRSSGQRALVTAAIAVPMFALVTSADLPTALLTHGLYLNLLLIACFHDGDVQGSMPAAPVQSPRRI